LRNPDYKKSGVGLVFIWYMGDWMCPAVPDEWILEILKVVKADRNTEFLSCTKNSPRYLQLAETYGWKIFPENLWFGTTIETNRSIANQFTKAPSVYKRYRAMTEVPKEKKFLSIEPKMNCDPKVLVRWAEDMEIKIVEVGADNYGNNLPEPEGWKVKELLTGLEQTCDLVVVMVTSFITESFYTDANLIKSVKPTTITGEEGLPKGLPRREIHTSGEFIEITAGNFYQRLPLSIESIEVAEAMLKVVKNQLKKRSEEG